MPRTDRLNLPAWGAAATALGAGSLLVLGTVSSAGALGPEDGDGVLVGTYEPGAWSFLGIDGPNDLGAEIDLAVTAGLDPEELGDTTGAILEGIEYVTSPTLLPGMSADRDYVDLLVSAEIDPGSFGCLILRADAESGDIVLDASGFVADAPGEPFLTDTRCTGIEYLPAEEELGPGGEESLLVVWADGIIVAVDPSTKVISFGVFFEEIFGTELPGRIESVAYEQNAANARFFFGTDNGVVVFELGGGSDPTVSFEVALEGRVSGLDLDASGNLWAIVHRGDPEATSIVAFSSTSLGGLAFVTPTPIPTPTLDVASEGSESLGLAEFLASGADVETEFRPAVEAVPEYEALVTLGETDDRLESITAVPTGSVFTAEAELAQTGADDQLIVVISVIAGALLVGGIVVLAVGASRRRAHHD